MSLSCANSHELVTRRLVVRTVYSGANKPLPTIVVAVTVYTDQTSGVDTDSV